MLFSDIGRYRIHTAAANARPNTNRKQRARKPQGNHTIHTNRLPGDLPEDTSRNRILKLHAKKTLYLSVYSPALQRY